MNITNLPPASTDELILGAIRKAIEEQVEEAVRQSIEHAKQALSYKISDIVAKVALDVCQMFTVERLGTELLIRVKVEGLK